MPLGHVAAGRHGVTNRLNLSPSLGTVLKVNVINMEPTLFRLKLKLKWNGYTISWTGTKVQVRDRRTKLITSKYDQSVDPLFKQLEILLEWAQ